VGKLYQQQTISPVASRGNQKNADVTIENLPVPAHVDVKLIENNYFMPKRIPDSKDWQKIEPRSFPLKKANTDIVFSSVFDIKTYLFKVQVFLNQII